MLSQILTWGMAIVLMIFLPRILGAEGVGQLHLADSVWAIVGILIGFGMDIYLTKEIARVPEKTGELLGNSMVLRTLLFVLGFAGVVLYVNLAGYATLTVWVIYLYGFGRLVAEFSSGATSALVGLERMEYVAFANILSRLFATVVTIAVLLMGYGVLAAAAVYAASSAVSVVIQLVYMGRLQPLRFTFQRDLAWQMLRVSAPYLLVTLFSVAYMNLDAIIISLVVDETTLGWYSAADLLFGTMMFVPVVFITAVFPALSRLNVESPQELRKLMRRSFDLLLILGVPIGLGTMGIANGLVVLLYGADFAPSGPVLAVLGIVLIFTYQNILLGRFLIAVDRQNVWTVVMGVATLLTIPLDLIFIPWMHNRFGNGAIGGALSFVVTEVGMMLFGLRYLPAGSLTRKNGWVAVRVIGAGLVMTAVVWALRGSFIALPIVAGAVTYTGLILLLRVVSDEDKLMFKDQFQRITRRVRVFAHGRLG